MLNFTPKCPNQNKPALVHINRLVPNRCEPIIWTNNGLVYWRIYAAPGVDEIKTIPDKIDAAFNLCIYTNAVYPMQYAHVFIRFVLL